jgi:N-methylhydantoinase A/oxoprolinase/acetone carboxylase beta subunit
MLAGEPGSALVGAAHLSGVGDAVVVAVDSATTYIGALGDGIPRDMTGPTEIAGVRLSLRRPDARRVAFGAPLPREQYAHQQRRAFARALMSADTTLAHALDEARAARSVVPLVVVGPGGALVPDQLDGAGEVIRPRDGELAHAIGATVAQVSGEVTRIYMDRSGARRAVLEDAQAAALARAIDAGADPDRVAIIEVDEAPLTHLAHAALRIRVRASGPCW